MNMSGSMILEEEIDENYEPTDEGFSFNNFNNLYKNEIKI